jgi:hypothetical protein
VAGEGRLSALGKAGLPRTVAPHHEGDTGLGVQRQTCLAADAAKAADADGVEKHPAVRVRATGGVRCGARRPVPAERLTEHLLGRLGEGGRFEAAGQPGERRGSAAVVESLPVELRGLVVIVVFRDLGDNMG